VFWELEEDEKEGHDRNERAKDAVSGLVSVLFDDEEGESPEEDALDDVDGGDGGVFAS
jgi:hypothetical protein